VGHTCRPDNETMPRCLGCVQRDLRAIRKTLERNGAESEPLGILLAAERELQGLIEALEGARAG